MKCGRSFKQCHSLATWFESGKRVVIMKKCFCKHGLSPMQDKSHILYSI